MRHVFTLITCASAALVTAAVASCGASGVGNTSSNFGGHTATGSSMTGESGGAGTGGSTSTGIHFGGNGGSGGATCPGATTCAKAGVGCGPIADGCGGVLQCGSCTAPATCGGGNTPGQCGTPPCAAKTCMDLGATCGPVGDGCGMQIDCGTCTAPQTCGGGGVASVCGTGPCTPKTCAGQAVNCGPIADGCGSVLQCGACTAPQTCGGGGVASVCGAPPCSPKTCATLGLDCGPASNGCGGLLQCGACSLPQSCGGAGMPSVCGTSPTCTGLCLQQVSCSSPAVTTTLTGTVYAPNGTDPLPNALVYVPNAPVQPFAPGVSCDNCASTVSGSPLVSTVTAVNGTFSLGNVPVGANIPLVIQLGRWRRQVTITNVPACQSTPVAATLTNMPQCSETNASCPAGDSRGDIPLMAFSTGVVDALECVMRKIGIDDTEFTIPGGGGRINLYEGLVDNSIPEGAEGGATLPGAPTEDQLWTTQAALNQYDMVLFPCQQNQTTRTSAVQQNLIDYANAGGRVFATHFSYVWLYNDMPFDQTAMWDVEQHPSPTSAETGFVNMSFPKGLELAQWLVVVGASDPCTFSLQCGIGGTCMNGQCLGQIPLDELRHDFNNVVAPSQSWITINDDPNFPGMIVDYTFNTPIGAPAAQQCGRVLFDDFHVENVSNAEGLIFPSECVAGAMTAQEKLLEFMIFDLSSCVTPDQPTCTPTTCAAQGLQCGPAGDGCGNEIMCGTCPAGETCGGGGVPSVCGAPTCTSKTCAQQMIDCGPAGDGCGNPIDCGACPSGQTCGGGGMPSVCGSQPCTPRTCAEQGVECGPAGDGCGGLIQCGSCTSPDTCGGGMMSGICGTEPCKPKTCMELGANCGPVGDGCGNEIMCGSCSPPQTCGGGGTPSVCGGSGPQ
jgi:hypothetical protein